MACCCNCNCANKQWSITLSQWKDVGIYGTGAGTCLNATYLFPFSGGTTFLCDLSVDGRAFGGGAGITKYRRLVRVATSGCSESIFDVEIAIGSNVMWDTVSSPSAPSNWNATTLTADFSGWRWRPSQNCSSTISVDLFLATTGYFANAYFIVPTLTGQAMPVGNLPWGVTDNTYLGATRNGAFANFTLS